MDIGQSARLDESIAELCEIPLGTRTVHFGNRNHRAIDRTALSKAISGQPGTASVTILSIDWNSEMTSAWASELFPNLTVVDIFGSKLVSMTELERVPHLKALLVQTDESSHRSLDVLPRLRLESLFISRVSEADISYLNACQELRSLELGRWPLATFEKIKIVPREQLATWGEMLIATAGLGYRETGLAMFMSCSNLKSLIELAAPIVRIKSCRQLDLTTLASVRGLRQLAIQQHGTIHSLEFLRDCAGLEELSIAATQVDVADWSPLAESKSLRRVLLCPPVTAEQIREVSASNERFAITNAVANYRAGREISLEELYK